VAGGAALLLLAVRAFVNRVAPRLAAARCHLEEPSLKPVEFAYLLREGEMSSVMVVLVVDLIHRAVKSQRAGQQSFSLAPCEEKAWRRVKALLKEWGEDQIGGAVPDPQSDSLRQMGVKLSRLYRFFSRTLRSFAAEVASDPKKIRKYFSFAGVARLVVELGSSGYRQALAQELAGELLSRRLLAGPGERRSRAYLCALAFALAVLCLVAASMVLLPDRAFAVAVLALGALNAAGLSCALFLRDLLPLYAELKDVLEHVKRSGKRLAVARFVLSAVAFVTAAAFSAAVTGALALEVLAMRLAAGVPASPAALAVAASTACWLAAIQFGLDAWTLPGRVQPSLPAIALLRAKRARLAHLSPIEEFKKLLAEPGYDPTFAELLAVYGLETLWLLA